YRSGGKGNADRGSFLRLYNGGPHTIDRIIRGVLFVPNWSGCILGGIQPGPIQRIARDAEDDGLLQRFCFCVPDHVSDGVDRAPDGHALQRYAQLIPALAALQPSRTPGNGQLSRVVLHANARRFEADTREIAQAAANFPDTSLRLKSALRKWPGLFARLALTFHLIEVADARLMGTPKP